MCVLGMTLTCRGNYALNVYVYYTSKIDSIFSLSYIAVQIGFQQNSYTVSERNESVTVCVQMTTGNYTVPVTRAVLYTGSAQSMYPVVLYMYIHYTVPYNCNTVLSARLLCMGMCKLPKVLTPRKNVVRRMTRRGFCDIASCCKVMSHCFKEF